MPLTFHHRQLANGLDVIAETNPDSHSTAIGMFVNTGARDEEVLINGVSHFLEHMMFKGSEKYTWEDVNRIFDELGARYNAFTSQEMTAYYANVLPEFTERAVEHLSHLLRPAIRDEDFTTENKVIPTKMPLRNGMLLNSLGSMKGSGARRSHHTSATVVIISPAR